MTTTERPTTEALASALYDDGCIKPPQTDHSDHVITALRRKGFRILPDEPTAPTLDFDSASALLSAYNYWLDDHPDASVGDRYDWTKRYLARLADEPDHEHRYVGADPRICQICLAAEPDGEDR